MALDQQRNWDMSMADNLQQVISQASRMPPPLLEKEKSNETETTYVNSRPWRPAVYLPDEIVLEILDYVRRNDRAQQTLHACTILSRQWYIATIPFLYAYPDLYGKNYDPFVRAICPSINLHVRRIALSELVRVLDMSRLVHQGSKSITARLLGRTKDSLETFVAPQASFAINCFPALAKCKNLRKLDLSLVSEAASLQTLFNTVKGLRNLKELRLPRSSGFGAKVEPGDIIWPPGLEKLFLSGGIDAHFLYGVVHLPQTLCELTLEHCPLAKGHAVRQFLETIAIEGVPLRYLRLSHMPRLGGHAFDYVLALLPGLERLSVSVDYISPNLIDQDFQNFPPNHLQLKSLELTNSGNPGVEDKISPIDIIIAMDDGSLSNLRQVKIAKSLGWHHPLSAEDFGALDDQLRDTAKAAQQSVPSEGMPNIRPGAWTIDG